MSQSSSYCFYQDVLADLTSEMDRAWYLHDDIVSVHEALAVIREEYLEAEREAFTKYVNPVALRRELLHTAGVCLRAIIDLHLDADEMTREEMGRVIQATAGILRQPESGADHE